MISSATSSAAPLALAPHHLRLFALIIDYLLAIVMLNLAHKASLGAHWDLNPQPFSGDQSPALWFAAAMVVLLAKDGLNGRSPGKWFMGIAVVRANDPAAVPGLPRLVLRNLTLAILPLEAVAVFMDRYYRRLGDRLAGTVVVAAGNPAHLTRRLLGMAVLFLATMLAILLVEFWNVRRSAAYQTALGAASRYGQVHQAVGDGMEFGGSPSLARTPDGQQTTVVLDVEGARGEAQVEVVLRLERAPLRWRVASLRLLEAPLPPPEVQTAPSR